MDENKTSFSQHDLFGAAPQIIVPKTAKPVIDRLADVVKPDMVRVAPGKFGWIPKSSSVPEFVLCRWVKQGSTGDYVPIPIGGRWVRLTHGLCSMLGFNDGSRAIKHETLMRLGRAGFIDLAQISPGVWMIDLDSWFRHVSSCIEEPEMWQPGSESLKEYLMKNSLGGWRSGLKTKKRRKMRRTS